MSGMARAGSRGGQASTRRLFFVLAKELVTPPVYLRLSVTDRCNLRCRYCRTDGQTATAPGLPDEAMLRIVRAMARLVPMLK